MMIFLLFVFTIRLIGSRSDIYLIVIFDYPYSKQLRLFKDACTSYHFFPISKKNIRSTFETLIAPLIQYIIFPFFPPFFLFLLFLPHLI